MVKSRINVLKDAQDLIIVGKSGSNYVYAVKPSLDVMKGFYEQSMANYDDRNFDAFTRFWEFNSRAGIMGSSTFLTLRFDKSALRANNLWVPGLLEAKVLKRQGRLGKGVYRDYGVVLCSDNEPNKQIAKTLVSQAKGLGIKLPLVVPFRALDYRISGNQIDVSFAKIPKGIISGKTARNEINSFVYSTGSGLAGLYLNGDLNLYSDDEVLDYSGDSGRVDWVCGEATQKFLERAGSELSERKYSEKIRGLKEEQEREAIKFRESLKR